MANGSTTKWVIFDPNTFKRIRTITLKHKSNLLYVELEPFEKDLKSKGLAAHRHESLNQSFLKGKTFKEKLKILGW